MPSEAPTTLDEGLTLMSVGERRLVEIGQLPHTGFVADFAKWAARKTDAPPYTLKAAGLMALSLAAGDGVVMEGIFNDKYVHMNLYIVIVGASTVLRKSTVLGYTTSTLGQKEVRGGLGGGSGRVLFSDVAQIQVLPAP